MKCNWDCLLSWSIISVGKLMAVQTSRDDVLYVLQNDPLKDSWWLQLEQQGNYHWCDGWFLWHRHKYGGLRRTEPGCRDKLKISTSTPTSWTVHTFSVWLDTVSRPVALLELIFIRAELTWCSCKVKGDRCSATLSEYATRLGFCFRLKVVDGGEQILKYQAKKKNNVVAGWFWKNIQVSVLS